MELHYSFSRGVVLEAVGRHVICLLHCNTRGRGRKLCRSSPAFAQLSGVAVALDLCRPEHGACAGSAVAVCICLRLCNTWTEQKTQEFCCYCS